MGRSATEKDDFEGFQEILSGLRLPKQVKDHLKHSDIWSRWADIVGAELSRVTAPSLLKEKILEINVAHQAWAQQLHFLKPSLLGKIRAMCPQSAIKDLFFRVAKVSPPPADPKKVRVEPHSPSAGPAKLSERQEMTLRAVEDIELRASIRRAMEAESRRHGF